MSKHGRALLAACACLLAALAGWLLWRSAAQAPTAAESTDPTLDVANEPVPPRQQALYGGVDLWCAPGQVNCAPPSRLPDGGPTIWDTIR